MTAKVWRLTADDGDEGWHELALYAARADAEADLAHLEERYPGRPHWIAFGIEEVAVVPHRATAADLTDSLIAMADLSEIEPGWTNPRNPDSWWSEHGAPRPGQP